MRRAVGALAAALALAGCGAASIDPEAATCSDVGEISGLDSVSRSLAEKLEPKKDPDKLTGEIAIIISQECEDKPLSYKPVKPAEKKAKEQLGI